jgi:hypothetical protein
MKVYIHPDNPGFWPLKVMYEACGHEVEEDDKIGVEDIKMRKEKK